jgi:hypothetical protein
MDDFVDIVEGEDGTNFLRVRTAHGWTMIVSPSGKDLAEHQAKAVRQAIALAVNERRTSRLAGLRDALRRMLWG